MIVRRCRTVLPSQSPAGCGGHRVGFLVYTRATGEFLREDLFIARAQTEDLETARVGVGGAIPVHELGHSPGPIHQFGAGLKIQMVGISQNCLCA